MLTTQKGSYYHGRSQDREFIIGATAPSKFSTSGAEDSQNVQKTRRTVKIIFSLKDIPFPKEILSRLTGIDEASLLNADYLPDGHHSFRDRVDLTEFRLNQGSTAAYKAYVNSNKELIPFSLTFFGRGKHPDFPADPNQYAEPGFAPVRGNIPLEMHPEPVQKAVLWSEFILDERSKGRFPLNGKPDEPVLRHHNEVVLNYWIHTGLLQFNHRSKRSWYQYPLRTG